MPVGQSGAQGGEIHSVLRDVEVHAIEVFHHGKHLAALGQACHVANEHKKRLRRYLEAYKKKLARQKRDQAAGDDQA